MSEFFLDGRIELHCGDCLAVLPTLADNSVDSCVTDPPYHLTSIVKRFGAANAAAAKDYTGARSNATGAYARASKGFMGKQWDGGDIAFRVETWREVFRVLKPGAHLVAFSGTRTYHRMACAIEDAGFEIRDQIQWLYGSGFPKSHDVSKGIDRSAGAERKVVGRKSDPRYAYSFEGTQSSPMGHIDPRRSRDDHALLTAPATDAAATWEGWGTALKPACEPIVLARKPLSESTVASNVLKWGTGALNIDDCRVEGVPEATRFDPAKHGHDGYRMTANGAECAERASPLGRWPANVIHDGSEEVVGAFPDNLTSGTGAVKKATGAGTQANAYGKESRPAGTPNVEYGDTGSAARFFYTAKADADDRLGSKHPTVKPIDIIEYLERLVTPPGGIVLDCFAGTGTAGEAAFRQGFKAILIEREEEYQADIRRRMALCMSGAGERARESIKARTKDKPIDHGPLFGPVMTTQTDDTTRPSREIA